MKRFTRILTAILILLLSPCCGKPSLTLSGYEVESLHIGKPIQAEISLQFARSSREIRISDISGVISNGEKALIDFEAEPFSIPRGENVSADVSITASPSEGVGIFGIMRIYPDGMESLSGDISFKVRGPLGIWHKKEVKGIRLNSLIGTEL